MKIEVTHIGVDTTTIRVESEFLAKKDIPHVTQLLLMLAEGRAEPSELHHLQLLVGIEAPPTVNVFVDGAKVAAQPEIGKRSVEKAQEDVQTLVDALVTERDTARANAKVWEDEYNLTRTELLAMSADAHLGRMVRKMQNDSELLHRAEGFTYCIPSADGGQTFGPFQIPQDASEAAGVKS